MTRASPFTVNVGRALSCQRHLSAMKQIIVMISNVPDRIAGSVGRWFYRNGRSGSFSTKLKGSEHVLKVGMYSPTARMVLSSTVAERAVYAGEGRGCRGLLRGTGCPRGLADCFGCRGRAGRKPLRRRARYRRTARCLRPVRSGRRFLPLRVLQRLRGRRIGLALIVHYRGGERRRGRHGRCRHRGRSLRTATGSGAAGSAPARAMSGSAASSGNAAARLAASSGSMGPAGAAGNCDRQVTKCPVPSSPRRCRCLCPLSLPPPSRPESPLTYVAVAGSIFPSQW